MHGRTTFVLLCAVLLSMVGCKSGSANADEVLTERTKRAEATEAKSSSDGEESGEDGEAAEEEQGASKSTIRLFDEDEVDDSEGGPVEIGGASDDSVKLTVDQSSCETFGASMKASVGKLETNCEVDADCAVLQLPCALGCGRAVRAYSNLDQVEDFAAQYVDECPNCKKMCKVQPDWTASCVEGACVAEPPREESEPATEDATDGGDESSEDDAIEDAQTGPEEPPAESDEDTE